MSDARTGQKREELQRFKATAIYEDIVGAIKEHRRQLVMNLLSAALRSHDPNVRVIAEAIFVDMTFDRELRKLESPNNFKGRVDIKEESKQYREYSTLLDLDFEPDQEYA